MTSLDILLLILIFITAAVLGYFYYPFIVNPWLRRRAPKIAPQDMNRIQRQGILYGAFLSARNNDKPFDSLATRINYVRYGRVLRRDWDIKGRESALSRRWICWRGWR